MVLHVVIPKDITKVKDKQIINENITTPSKGVVISK